MAFREPKYGHTSAFWPASTRSSMSFGVAFVQFSVRMHRWGEKEIISLESGLASQAFSLHPRVGVDEDIDASPFLQNRSVRATRRTALNEDGKLSPPSNCRHASSMSPVRRRRSSLMQSCFREASDTVRAEPLPSSVTWSLSSSSSGRFVVAFDVFTALA